MKRLYLDDKLVPGLADNINALFNYLDRLSEKEKQSLSQKVHRLAVLNYSWDMITRRYLDIENERQNDER